MIETAFFTEGTVTAATEDGPREVPALTTPLVPGLAITMCGFGLFEVTHVGTGRKMPGARSERYGTAMLDFAEYALIGRAYGVDWSADKDTIAEAMRGCADKQVPFDGATITNAEGTRRMTVGEWHRGLNDAAAFGAFMNEFPWEAPDESPDATAMKLLDTLLAPEAPAAGA